jgi:hypothetical protein
MRTASRGAITLAVLVVLALMVVPTTAFGSSGQGQGQGSENSNAGGNGKGDSAKNGGEIPTSDNDGDANSDGGSQVTEDTDQTDEHNPAVDNNIVDGPGDNAHPSDKDRSVEHDSGNQGNSESNPDDTNGPGDRWEGQEGQADRPDGWGGEDLDDQDGNNGCGNDDDFDDDNNGKCGEPGPPENPPENPPANPPGGGGDVILPNVIFRHPQPDTVIQGKRIVSHPRPPLQAQLPFTGAGLAPYLLLGLGLVTGGAALSAVRPRRNRGDQS